MPESSPRSDALRPPVTASSRTSAKDQISYSKERHRHVRRGPGPAHQRHRPVRRARGRYRPAPQDRLVPHRAAAGPGRGDRPDLPEVPHHARDRPVPGAGRDRRRHPARPAGDRAHGGLPQPEDRQARQPRRLRLRHPLDHHHRGAVRVLLRIRPLVRPAAGHLDDRAPRRFRGLTDTLLLMALGMLLTRTLGLAVRAHALPPASTPTATASRSVHDAKRAAGAPMHPAHGMAWPQQHNRATTRRDIGGVCGTGGAPTRRALPGQSTVAPGAAAGPRVLANAPSRAATHGASLHDDTGPGGRQPPAQRRNP